MKLSRIPFVLLAIFISPLVSAYSFFPSNIGYQMQNAILTLEEFLRPVLEAVIGGYSSEQFFFVKVLLVILLFIVCRYALKNVPTLDKQNAVVNIMAAVVSILAVRFLQDNDLINGILLPYGVLGIALTAILPFIIYFFFVQKSITHTSGRRLAWVFYLVIFGVLWNARATALSPLGNQIYLWTFVAGAIALIFDKGIHNYFGFAEDAKRRRELFDRQIANIDANLARYYTIDNPSDAVKNTIKVLEERRKELRKQR